MSFLEHYRNIKKSEKVSKNKEKPTKNLHNHRKQKKAPKLGVLIR